MTEGRKLAAVKVLSITLKNGSWQRLFKTCMYVCFISSLMPYISRCHDKVVEKDPYINRQRLSIWFLALACDPLPSPWRMPVQMSECWARAETGTRGPQRHPDATLTSWNTLYWKRDCTYISSLLLLRGYESSSVASYGNGGVGETKEETWKKQCCAANERDKDM